MVEQRAVSRQQTAENREQTADSRQQTAESREQRAESREQGAESRELALLHFSFDMSVGLYTGVETRRIKQGVQQVHSILIAF
jgi:hypothetical protein